MQRFQVEERNTQGGKVFAIRDKQDDKIVGGNFDREKAEKSCQDMNEFYSLMPGAYVRLK